MNNASFFLLSCAVCVGMTACSAGGKDSDAPSASAGAAGAARADTARRAAASKQPEKPEYKSVDLKLFELYGPVRKCVYKNKPANPLVDDHVANRNIGKVVFDEKGRLIGMNKNYISYPEKGPSVLTSDLNGCHEVHACKSASEYIGDYYQRDAEGRLTCLVYPLRHTYAMVYDEEGRTRKFLFYSEAEAELKDSIVRANEHLWPEVIRVVNSAEDLSEFDQEGIPLQFSFYEATITYEYTRTDSHGNWTERTAVVEGKKAEDYDPDFTGYYDSLRFKWKKFGTTYTDRREITYYE